LAAAIILQQAVLTASPAHEFEKKSTEKKKDGWTGLRNQQVCGRIIHCVSRRLSRSNCAF